MAEQPTPASYGGSPRAARCARFGRCTSSSSTTTLHPILPRTGETQTAEFTRINPRQKIPVLQDGDFTIAESPAIVAYLSDTYGTGGKRLVPRDPRQRATGWNGASTSPWSSTPRASTSCAATATSSTSTARRRSRSRAPAAYFQTQLRHVVHALGDGRPTWSATASPAPTCCSPPAWSGRSTTASRAADLQRLRRPHRARPAYQAALRANLPPPPPATGKPQ